MTDNGPPFNSSDFKALADELGFQHKKITPRHPKAQGQVENFNKLINKTVKIAHEGGNDMEGATYDILQAYRQTPHPATKASPYELLINRQVRTRLEHFNTKIQIPNEELRKNDEVYKQRLKQYHDKRHRVKKHALRCGDAVLIKRERKRKAETPYEPHIYTVICIKGSTIIARRNKDGKTTCRDASKVKHLRTDQLQERQHHQQREHVEIPSTYKAKTSTITDEGSSRGNEITPTEVTAETPVVTSNDTILRRSQRSKKSTYESIYKNFVK